MCYTVQTPPDVLATLRTRHAIPADVTVEFVVLPEHTSPSDSFDDDETVEWVTREYDSGNDAAWFMACVKVTDGDAEGMDHLGGCSYKSFDDFLVADDYFGDMVGEAFREYTSEAARLKTKYCTEAR